MPRQERDILQGLAILDLCGKGTWTDLVSHDTVKGVPCETMSEPLPSPVSLAVGWTPRAKENVFTHTSRLEKCHLTVLAFLLYEQ